MAPLSLMHMKKKDAKEIANSLEEICSPNDFVGWASSGVYSFWNFDTKEIYYIGLAIDLGERFKQHNGILPIRDTSCKHQQIKEYFISNEKLGFTIFVQSPLCQAQTHNNRDGINLTGEFEWIHQESKNDIKIVEGSFIEAFKKRNGGIPRWNKIDGFQVGKNRATIDMYIQMYGCLTGNVYDLLIARSSLREIAKDSTIEWYETSLHGVRMSMLSRHISFQQSINEMLAINPHFNQVYEEIVANHYLEKYPSL